MKTAFLQGKKIKRTVYLRSPREANTKKIWELQKCVHGLADASHYLCLYIREELFRLGGKLSRADPVICYQKENSRLLGLVATMGTL